MRKPKPRPPGEILLSTILPFDLSQNALARKMGVPPRRINEIILGKRRITADTAIGLGEAGRAPAGTGGYAGQG